MKNKQQLKFKIIGNYLILIIIALLMLFPLFWLISTSLKSPTENVFSFPPQLLPKQPTLDNFKTVWETYPFGSYLWNSTIVAVLSVVLNLLFCSLAAYPLARLDFTGKKIIFALIISTIMIPFQIVMIPLYILIVQLGVVVHSNVKII
jgi:putative chitobiose transport system permease protein